jgi:hypothetical protein
MNVLTLLTTNTTVFGAKIRLFTFVVLSIIKQGAWETIVNTLWNGSAGRLRMYTRPTDIPSFRKRFYAACEQRCTRVQRPGQHSVGAVRIWALIP